MAQQFYKRYSGSFVSREGHIIRAEIWQMAATDYAEVGDLTFPADEPIVIEWEDTDGKATTVQGSTATVKLISPGDRTYQDLYTVKPGQIRLDTYRDGALYWSGMLDPECYEEPYSYGANYEVTFTFTDFGILDRITFSETLCEKATTGLMNCADIAEAIMQKSGIFYVGLRDYMTTVPAGEDAPEVPGYAWAAGALSRYAIRADNFIDEDGEASTLREVLDGILQPLAGRIVQRGGYIYLYELDAAYRLFPRQAVCWTSDDQTLATDRVYNRCVVTFSPYSKAELMTEESLNYVWPYQSILVDPATGEPAGDFQEKTDGGNTQAVYVVRQDFSDDTRCFDCHIHQNIEGTSGYRGDTGIAYLDPTAYLFKNRNYLDGDSSVGVVALIRYGRARIDTGTCATKMFSGTWSSDNKTLFKTKPVFIPKKSGNKAYLRMKIALLFDARYNPFNDDADYNEKDNYERSKDDFKRLYSFARIRLLDKDGTVIYHYNNDPIQPKSGYSYVTFTEICNQEHGDWIKGDWGDYEPEVIYEFDDEGNQLNVGHVEGMLQRAMCRLWWFGESLGWKTNDPYRFQIFDINETDFPKKTTQKFGWEYLPYPPEAAFLEVEIISPIWGFTLGRENIRWILFKHPVLEVVDDTLEHNKVEQGDLEYAGIIDAEAKEDLKIDTICGTAAEPCVTARGNFYAVATSEQISEVTRAGRTGQAEQLLIGTMLSQYGARRVKLTGTARLTDGGAHLLTDAAQPADRRFIIEAETVDLQADEREVTMTELRPDDYDPRSLDNITVES